MLRKSFLFALLVVSRTNAYILTTPDGGTTGDICYIDANNPKCENCDGSENFSGFVNIRTWNSTNNQDLNTVPEWLFEQFENLENFYVASSCNLHFIQNVEETTYKNAKNLKRINFALNLISILGPNSFKGADNLEEIDLGFNQIDFVHENALKMIPKLTVLKLAWNSIRFLSKDFFINNPNLKTFAMDANKLVTLDPDLFLHNSELETIDLRSNTLSGKIELKFGVYSLKSLDMSYNKIEEIIIDQESCGSRSGTETLKFLDNHLSTYSISTCRKDVRLNFRSNWIEKPGSFKDPLAVTDIILLYNPIRDISLLSAFGNLQHLEIRSTNIETLDSNSFVGLQNLKELMIGYNNLGNFDLNVLHPLQSLDWLELGKSNRTLLDFHQLQEILPNLKKVSIEINSLACATICQIENEVFPFEIGYMKDQNCICN